MSGLRRAGRIALDALRLEVGLYRCLARWILRRPDVPAGTQAVGYGALAAPMIALFAFASALEVPLVHVLVPWEPVRLPLLVVGVWSVLWMLGLLAAYRVRPHLLADDELRVRNSGLTQILVPRERIAGAVATERDAPGSVRSVHVIEEDDGDVVVVAVSGRTNLSLRLSDATPLRTPRGVVDAVEVRLWVDDPRAVAALLRPEPVRGRRSAPTS